MGGPIINAAGVTPRIVVSPNNESRTVPVNGTDSKGRKYHTNFGLTLAERDDGGPLEVELFDGR